MAKPPTRYALFHCGEGGCGQVAFFLVNKPVPYEPIQASNVRTLEGGVEPAANQPIECGSCGRHLGGDNLQTGYVTEVQ